MAKRTFEASAVRKENCPDTSVEKIKLCGYLKKKRNKVGGWRKLWFVLHDRLLVSYASREEYYNKLVSFKDVLNLVPGTQIRPMEGFRFTIETTTQVVYTFHCDDHTAYREWIAMLLDSAGTALNCSRKFHYFSAHSSMQWTQTKGKSCDLVTGAEHSALRKCTYNEKEMLNQKAGNRWNSCADKRKPSANIDHIESQALKKQIERMSISGTEDYRCMAFTPCVEHNRCKMVTTQTTEHFPVEPLPLPCKVGTKHNSEKYKAREPVYAVVDLKSKYDQRKKRSELLEEKRCTSYESIHHYDKANHKEKSQESLFDVVYEDGDVFFNRTINDGGQPSNDIEENIYEPINVGQKTSMFEFRKYIARLKLNPFLSRTSARKLKANCLDANIPSSNGTMSRFSTLRWKLGKHRKSVQRRMRKLYSNAYEPNPLFQYQAKDIPTYAPDEDKFKDNNNLKNDNTRSQSPSETESLSNQDSTKEQAESCAQRLDSVPILKKVAKITLFKNAEQ